MARKSLVFSLVLLVATLAAGTASARTIHVNAAYTGLSQDGTAERPFRTIQQGIGAAVTGTNWDNADVVQVAPGSYYGRFVPKNFVKIVGTDPLRTVVIDPMVTATIQLTNAWLERLTFYDDCHDGFLIQRFTNTPATWEFRECIFRDIRRGIHATGPVHINLTRCLFFGSSDNQYPLFLERYSGTCTIVNCTFDQPRYAAIYFKLSPAGRVDVTNSIFANGRPVDAISYTYPRGTVDYGNRIAVRYSDFWNAALPASVVRESATILYANPQFRSPAVWNYGYPVQPPDYRLLASSPCIDKGTYVGLPFLGLAPDMGAYEHDGGMTLPEALEALAASYADLTADDLYSPEDQRRNAFLNKMEAVDRQYESIKTGALVPTDKRAAYVEMRDKLSGDLLAKCDGDRGGNPENDWISDTEERAALYDLITQTITLIDKEISLIK